MPGVLLDTSILIAPAEAIDPSDEAAISVVSIGELRAGVLRAADATTRSERQARFATIRAAFEPLPVDEEITVAQPGPPRPRPNSEPHFEVDLVDAALPLRVGPGVPGASVK